MTNGKDPKLKKIGMNKLEKGLILIGAVGSLTYLGFVISDVINLSHGKAESKATDLIGIASTACYIAGLSRIGYKKIKECVYQTKSEDYQSKK